MLLGEKGAVYGRALPEDAQCVLNRGGESRTESSEVVAISSHDGRLEKRIWLAVPVELLNSQDLSSAERAVTENVCSKGVRVLTRRLRQLNERLTVSFLKGSLRAEARVVYCQRLPDRRFGVGLQLPGVNANFVAAVQRWSENQA